MTVINLDVKQQPDPNDGDGHGRTRLHNLFYGLFQCELSELQKALKAGCDVNAADNWGDTPLHTLIGSMMNDAARADLMRALIEAGANVNAAGRRGKTPLQLAVGGNCKESAQVLLQAGANVNTQDKDGDTPLREAVDVRNTDMVKLLLEHGADAGIKNRYGESLTQEAISNENFACAELLQQYGARADGNGESVAAGTVPERENAQEDETDPTDITASGYSEAAAAEIHRWSNPNARDGKGMSNELIAIISIGIALAGLQLHNHHYQRADMQSLREETQAEFKVQREAINDLLSRMVRLEALFEDRRVAAGKPGSG